MKLLKDFIGKQGEPDGEAGKEAATDKSPGPGLTPAVAPVQLPVEMRALLGSAFLPRASDAESAAGAASVPAAENSTGQSVPPLTAVAVLPSTDEPDNAADAAATMEKGIKATPAVSPTVISAAPPDGEAAPAARSEAASVEAGGAGPRPRDAAPIAVPPQPILRRPTDYGGASERMAQTRAPMGSPSAVPAPERPSADAEPRTATFAFGVRLTPLASPSAAPTQPAAPATAPSGTPPLESAPVSPATHPGDTQGGPSHAPTGLPRLEPESAAAQPIPAPAMRSQPDGTLAVPVREPAARPTQSSGPELRSSPGFPAAAPEPVRLSPPPAAAHEIRLQVADNSQRVDVRLTERAGEVQVAVRTSDARLAGTLREDLGVLSARLEQAGFRAESWQPGGWVTDHRGQPTATRAAGEAAQGQEPGRQNHPQQRQPDSQLRTPAPTDDTGEPALEFPGVLEAIE